MRSHRVFLACVASKLCTLYNKTPFKKKLYQSILWILLYKCWILNSWKLYFQRYDRKNVLTFLHFQGCSDDAKANPFFIRWWINSNYIKKISFIWKFIFMTSSQLFPRDSSFTHWRVIIFTIISIFLKHLLHHTNQVKILKLPSRVFAFNFHYNWWIRYMNRNTRGTCLEK